MNRKRERYLSQEIRKAWTAGGIGRLPDGRKVIYLPKSQYRYIEIMAAVSELQREAGYEVIDDFAVASRECESCHAPMGEMSLSAWNALDGMCDACYEKLQPQYLQEDSL